MEKKITHRIWPSNLKNSDLFKSFGPRFLSTYKARLNVLGLLEASE